jgi:hypothetical protein
LRQGTSQLARENAWSTLIIHGGCRLGSARALVIFTSVSDLALVGRSGRGAPMPLG